MVEYRYKYQLVQALDDKIGPDLRKIVEGYLGSDPGKVQAVRSWAEIPGSENGQVILDCGSN
jgi:hypothetical protein